LFVNRYLKVTFLRVAHLVSNNTDCLYKPLFVFNLPTIGKPIVLKRFFDLLNDSVKRSKLVSDTLAVFVENNLSLLNDRASTLELCHGFNKSLPSSFLVYTLFHSQKFLQRGYVKTLFNG